MTYSYPNYSFDADVRHQTRRKAGASGIGPEAVHRIRERARIERAKIIRQGIGLLRRIVTRAES